MTPYLALQRGEEAFLIPTSIDAKVFTTGRRPEFPVLERACAVLRAGGRLAGGETFLDVGAHIGTATIPALLQQGFARAVAVEPDPTHLPLLRANIAINGLEDRVAVIAAAVSDSARQQHFSQIGRKSPGRWMKGRLTDEASPITVVVDTVTLDGLVAAGVVDPDLTGLLWFDCAGAEEPALEAASTFLERRVPIVFPLREHHVTNAGGLIARLRDTYESAVELRGPRLAEPLSTWVPAVVPAEDLASLVPGRKKLTDVLLF